MANRKNKPSTFAPPRSGPNTLRAGSIRPRAAFALLAVAGFLLPAALSAQTSIALLPVASPTAASPGGANVTVTASGFPAGTINPAQIQLAFTPVSSGPAVTAAATAVETVYGSEERVTFRVPATLTFSQPTVYAISIQGQTVGGALFVSGNSSQLTVNPPAAVQSVTPAYGLPGQTVSAVIAGTFTDFTPGATTLSFGAGSGITVAGLTVTSSTSATAQLQINPTATLSPLNVTLQTGVEIATLNAGFQIAGPASLQSLSPAAGPEGATFTLNVTGVNTHFSAATLVAFSGAGIAVNGISVSGPTSLAVNITVAANAPLGSQNLSVTTGPESVSSAFTVTPPLPIVSGVTPASGPRGTSLAVTVTGTNTHFSSASVVTFGGSGVTAGAPSSITATSLTVTVTIASNASLGAGSVTVQTGSESATSAAAFTVVPLAANVTGTVYASGGTTPVPGALVRLYQGSPLTLAVPQVTAGVNGAYAFPNVVGAFTIVALNSAKTQVGTVVGQVQSLLPLTANTTLSGTGQVTVDVSDSTGTAVPNANVTMSLSLLPGTTLTVPVDLSATLTATAVANTSGVATFNSFFAGSLFVSAGDPVTNHGGTTTGSVTSGGSVTLQLYFNINQAVAQIFSVLNGVTPGTNPPAGQNEAPFRLFSVLNGSTPGTTSAPGTNEAPFWIFSVLNGSTPGTTGAAGTNEAPFWIFSVLNGAVPGSTILAGANESVFPIFSVGNSTLNPMALRSAASKAASVSATSAVASTHVTLSAQSASAGQTVHVAATLDNASAGATTEFFINGESFGSYAAPFGFDLTLPYTQSQLNVQAVADGVSDAALLLVAHETALSIRGRIVDANLAPVNDKKVTLEYSGLRAEIFHFPAPLTSLPDLTGLTPAATRAVSALDLRNPNGVFGKDPLATGLFPDYAIRFRATLEIAQEGDYVFSLRGHEGVALKVAGQSVTDGGKVHLEKGSAPVEAVVYGGAGAMELQLLWQPPGQLLQPVADGLLWVRDSGLTATTDLSGQFEFTAVPSSFGTVRVVGEDVASEPTPAATGDIGVLTVRKTVQ